MVIFNNILYYDRYNALRLNHEKGQARSAMMNRRIYSLEQNRKESNTQFINYKVTLVYNMCI